MRGLCYALAAHPTQNKPIARELADHKVNPANDKLTVTVEDAPGAGGAHHAYTISGFDADLNPSTEVTASDAGDKDWVSIVSQNGPINQVGVNGVTHEALLAILIHRLRCFQAGPYACAENACALTQLEAAQESLHSRTRARMARGVEGTHKQ